MGRLRQVLFNLIGNAIKFTFQGSIVISVKKIVINSKDYISISVQDTGIGIRKKDMGKLFKMFTMIEDSKKGGHNKTGTGLGLYISKEISKKLSFRGDRGLTAQSTYNEGTCFSFILDNKKPSVCQNLVEELNDSPNVP